MVKLGTVAALVALLAAPAGAQLTLQPGETLLEVQAEGQARYLPDLATLNVGVVSTGATARAATDANARQMAAVVAALRQAGIEPRFIRTQQINVEPRFARGGPSDYQGQAEITGYVARNSVTVTVVRLERAPDVIAAAFGAGANSVYGPNLASEDPRKGLAEARASALAAAQANADAYARGLGMHVARVIRVSERGTNSQPADVVVSGSRVAAPSAPPAPRVSPIVATGEMQRTVTVWVDYALTR